jgi:GrpB-like predicted nucleotidyltransferase (UPF0157 family)
MKKYKFRKYSKNYPKLFEKEKTKIKEYIPDSIIEHIGSTSVEGLGGKGVIDILVCVSKKDLGKVGEDLSVIGYALGKTTGNEERTFFERNFGFLKKNKFHIQLTFEGSKTYKEAMKFRDKLRKNKDLRKKYSLIKQEAIKLKKERKEYRKFKNKFIQEVLRK